MKIIGFIVHCNLSSVFFTFLSKNQCIHSMLANRSSLNEFCLQRNSLSLPLEKQSFHRISSFEFHCHQTVHCVERTLFVFLFFALNLSFHFIYLNARTNETSVRHIDGRKPIFIRDEIQRQRSIIGCSAFDSFIDCFLSEIYRLRHPKLMPLR